MSIQEWAEEYGRKLGEGLDPKTAAAEAAKAARVAEAVEEIRHHPKVAAFLRSAERSEAFRQWVEGYVEGHGLLPSYEAPAVAERLEEIRTWFVAGREAGR